MGYNDKLWRYVEKCSFFRIHLAESRHNLLISFFCSEVSYCRRQVPSSRALFGEESQPSL